MTQCVLYEGRRVEALRKFYVDTPYGVIGKPMERSEGIDRLVNDINRFLGANIEQIQEGYLSQYTSANKLLYNYTQGCLDARDIQFTLGDIRTAQFANSDINTIQALSEHREYNEEQVQRAFSFLVFPKIDENTGIITLTYVFEASENPTSVDHSFGFISNIPFNGFKQVDIKDHTDLEHDPRRDLLSRMTPDRQDIVLSMIREIDQYNKSDNNKPDATSAFLQDLKQNFDRSFPAFGHRLGLEDLGKRAKTLQGEQDYTNVDSSLAQYLTTEFFEKLYSFDIEPSYWIKIAEENRGDLSSVAPYIDKYLGTNFNNLDDVNTFLSEIPEEHRGMFKNKIKELFLLTAQDWLSTSIKPNKDLDFNKLQELTPERCILSLTQYGKRLHDARVLLSKIKINQLTPVTKDFTANLGEVQNTVLQSLFNDENLNDVDSTLKQVGLTIDFYSALKDIWPDCDVTGAVPYSDRPMEKAILSSLGVVGGQNWQDLSAEVKSEFLLKLALSKADSGLFLKKPYPVEASADPNKQLLRDSIVSVHEVIQKLLSRPKIHNGLNILREFNNIDLSNISIDSVKELLKNINTLADAESLDIKSLAITPERWSEIIDKYKDSTDMLVTLYRFIENVPNNRVEVEKFLDSVEEGKRFSVMRDLAKLYNDSQAAFARLYPDKYQQDNIYDEVEALASFKSSEELLNLRTDTISALLASPDDLKALAITPDRWSKLIDKYKESEEMLIYLKRFIKNVPNNVVEVDKFLDSVEADKRNLVMRELVKLYEDSQAYFARLYPDKYQQDNIYDELEALANFKGSEVLLNLRKDTIRKEFSSNFENTEIPETQKILMRTICDYCNHKNDDTSRAIVESAFDLINPNLNSEAKTQAARKLLDFQENLPPEPKSSVAKKAALGLWIAAFVGAVVGAVALCLTGVGIPIAAAIFAPVAAAALAAVVKTTKELVVEHKEIKEVKNFRDALDEIVKTHKPQNPPAAEPDQHQPVDEARHNP